MKRMRCIGAQSVDVTELTAPLMGVEMLCRRDSDHAEHRTFVSTTPMDMHAISSMQLPLFGEPLASTCQ